MTRKREIIVVKEYGDENENLLGRECRENNILAENRELREVIADIKAVMREKNLVSLSAPAIGSDKRVFCIKLDGDIKTFINPVYGGIGEKKLLREKCVCLPGKEFYHPRYPEIMVAYQKITGEPVERKFIGLLALVYQHECQHLDGSLVSDLGMEIPEDFDSLSEGEKDQLIFEYLDTLDLQKKAIDKEIEENPELRQLRDGIKFMESVMKGETKLVPAPEARIPEKEEE